MLILFTFLSFLCLVSCLGFGLLFFKLNNINHFRDFVTTKYIAKVIVFLMKKKINGLINIGSGKKSHLKKIAIEMVNKYKKKLEIIDNINSITMVSDIFKLKKVGFKK